MSSFRMKIVEAVRDKLNSGDLDFPLAFTARKALIPRYELEETKELQVTVVPISTSRERLSRNEDRVEVTINVGVQQQIDTQNHIYTDRLDELVEAIAAYLLGSKVTIGTVSAGCQASESIVVDPESIDESHLFSGLVSATYRAVVPRESF